MEISLHASTIPSLKSLKSFLLGRRQAVSHWILIPVFPGSNPGAPTFFFALFLLFLASCTQSGTSGPSIQINVRDVASISSASGLQLFTLAPSVLPQLRAETAGQSGRLAITSLKYFIRSISICQSMNVTDSSYSNATDCLPLYVRPDNPAYSFTLGTDYSGIAVSARQDQVSFVDLMTAAGKSSLGGTFGLSRNHVGIYNWGYVEYYPPVKVTATVDVNNGTTAQPYYTHDGVTSHIGSGRHITQTTAHFVNGVAEEATVLLSSSSSWFRLHSPLTVAHSDIDAGSRFLLDLFFNSEGLIKGYSTALSLTGNYLLRDGTTTGSSSKIAFSPLEFTPMARSLDQNVKREAYTLDFSAVTGVTDRFKLRLDFFYAAEDSTMAIGGTEAKVLYRVVGQESSPFTVTEVADFPRIARITRNADGTLNLLSADETVIIQNFSRLTTVNSSGTASVKCTAHWAPSSCSGTLSVPYTLSSNSQI